MAVIKPDSTAGGVTIKSVEDFNTLEADEFNRNFVSFDNLRIISLSNEQDNYQIYELNESNQTSTDAFTNTVSYFLTLSSNTISEGANITANVSTIGVDEGTTLYWEIDANQGDFVNSSGSVVTVGVNADIILSANADMTTEGVEIANLILRTDNASGTIVATSPIVSILDTSETPFGVEHFTTTGSNQWTAPWNVYYVSVCCVGGGGGGAAAIGTSGGSAVSGGSGGGGGLAWKNNIAVNPGQTYTVYVGHGGSGGSRQGANSGGTSGVTGGYAGGDSYFLNNTTVKGGGGGGGGTSSGQGGTYIGQGGSPGRNGGLGPGGNGGGGAGGYNSQFAGGGGTGYSDWYTGPVPFQRTGGGGGSTYTNGRGSDGLNGTSSSKHGTPGSSDVNYNPDGSPATAAYGGGGGYSRMYPYYSSGTTGGSGTRGVVTIRYGAGKDYSSDSVI